MSTPASLAQVRRLCAALVWCLVPALVYPQYQIRSPHLQDPARAIGYVDSCAAFWLLAADTFYGGLFTDLDSAGVVVGSNKWMQSQSRGAYGFTRAFMLTGNEAYLAQAADALRFLQAHGWDPQYGGWFANTDSYGAPLRPGDPKSAYDQHYALLGLAAYVEATRDSAAWSWLLRGYASNEQHYWDARPGLEGYYDRATRDFSVRSGKSFNATVDAITTHALALYLMTGQAGYRERLRQITDGILRHLLPGMDSQAIGFVELSTSDWAPDNSQTMTIMGHVLKTAWCLARVSHIIDDPAYLPAAEKLARQVWTKGYDHDFGGPYKDYNRTTGQMLMWGHPDTAKAWWQMEQAVTAGLQMYRTTGDSLYLQMADETLGFFMRYFVDHGAGEVFADRNRYGRPMAGWGNRKGSNGKAAYHSIELGYYVYLYGNLLLGRGPATLHYRFAPADSTREVRLEPIAAPAGTIRIRSITRNGMPYASFDAAAMLLRLAPGDSGKFAVTFEPAAPTAVAALTPGPGRLTLEQNYPNPFNPSTTIAFELPAASTIRLQVLDLLGREVETLAEGPCAAGRHTVRMTARGLASGVYFYRLQAEGHSLVRRFMLLQ